MDIDGELQSFEIDSNENITVPKMQSTAVQLFVVQVRNQPRVWAYCAHWPATQTASVPLRYLKKTAAA